MDMREVYRMTRCDSREVSKKTIRMGEKDCLPEVSTEEKMHLSGTLFVFT